MATTTTRLMTFEEFEQLPDPRGGHYELHRGEPILVLVPKHGHYFVQQRLLSLLMQAAVDAGQVGTEMGYRPIPEHEYWVADVIFIARDRWNKIPDDGNLSGAPDLVVEVLSPSNRAAELLEKRQLCLENGSQEFWVVDPPRRAVEVSTAGGRAIVYKSGQQIPLFFGGSIAVDEIFN